jgi:hypothetical protein
VIGEYLKLQQAVRCAQCPSALGKRSWTMDNDGSSR